MRSFFPANFITPLTDEHKRNIASEIFAFQEPLKLRQITGVYFLFYERQLVYIGKAVCIMSRILQHHKEACKNFDAYAFIETSADEALARELQLIKAFQPLYNISGVEMATKEAKEAKERERQIYIKRLTARAERQWRDYVSDQKTS